MHKRTKMVKSEAILFSLQLIADEHIINSKPSPIGEETMDAYINVKNFGPIEKAEIDLRPLTVFVGESNTGKTYLAALIYALHQHFRGISQFPWADTVSTYFGIVLPFTRPLSTKSAGGDRTRDVRGHRKVKHTRASRSNFPICLNRSPLDQSHRLTDRGRLPK